MAAATLSFKGIPPTAQPKPNEKLPPIPQEIKSPIVAVETAAAKPVHAHKLFQAVFKLVGKKYPQIADELDLDQNDKDLLDEAFSPLFKKFFKSIGVGEDYISVIIAVIIVLAPRFLLIAGEIKAPHAGDKPKSEQKAPPPRAAPSGAPTAVSPAGASAWTWGGTKPK